MARAAAKAADQQDQAGEDDDRDDGVLDPVRHD